VAIEGEWICQKPRSTPDIEHGYLFRKALFDFVSYPWIADLVLSAEECDGVIGSGEPATAQRIIEFIVDHAASR
jgi:hypothetical protein